MMIQQKNFGNTWKKIVYNVMMSEPKTHYDFEWNNEYEYGYNFTRIMRY